MTASHNDLTLSLVLTSVPEPPGDEEADLGLQDKSGAVHAGRPLPKGGLRFTCQVEVLTRNGDLDFRGPLVHGTPGQRFIYLSWKRRQEAAAPWVQRVKVPLNGVAAVLDPARGALEADITGRRPHDPAPINWRACAR